VAAKQQHFSVLYDLISSTMYYCYYYIHLMAFFPGQPG